jgi:hypothetical protein
MENTIKAILAQQKKFLLKTWSTETKKWSKENKS